MENIDIKTIIYFVIAIAWFLYSSFKKSQKKAQAQTEGLPPLKEKDIKEIIKEDIELSRKHKEDIQIEYDKQIKKLTAKKTVPVPVVKKSSYTPIKQYDVDDEKLAHVLAGVDPRDMIIYSEILKRPVY